MAFREKNKLRLIETLSKCEDIEDAESYYQKLSTLHDTFKMDPQKQSLKSYLYALGNEERLLLLDSLSTKDRCVCELEVILGKSQPAVSHHIKILESAGFIRGWKKGKFTHFSLIKSQFDQLADLLQEWSDATTNWLSSQTNSPAKR